MVNRVQQNMLTILSELLNTNRPRVDVNKAKVVSVLSFS